jgi:hypothetical protein
MKLRRNANREEQMTRHFAGTIRQAAALILVGGAAALLPGAGAQAQNAPLEIAKQGY